MKVIMKRLYEGEGLPPNTRWDETCECVQSTFDDGATWVDTPGADPRYNPGNLAPPNDTTDPRCSAAAGMRVRIEQVLDAVFLADALIDAANAVFGVILFFNPPARLIWAIIIVVCEALYAIGLAALAASFTEAAYDELQCIFYRNIDNDGQMSAAQLSAINTEICSTMDVTVCAAMGLILNMLGFVGMSNAGALFGEDSDCDECGEWCYTWSSLSAMISDGWAYIPGGNTASSKYLRTIDIDGITITGIKWDYTFTGSSGGASGLWASNYDLTSRFITGTLSGDPSPLEWNDYRVPVGLCIGGNGDGESSTYDMSNIELRGLGTMPEWTNGTDCSE